VHHDCLHGDSEAVAGGCWRLLAIAGGCCWWLQAVVGSGRQMQANARSWQAVGRQLQAVAGSCSSNGQERRSARETVPSGVNGPGLIAHIETTIPALQVRFLSGGCLFFIFFLFSVFFYEVLDYNGNLTSIFIRISTRPPIATSITRGLVCRYGPFHFHRLAGDAPTCLPSWLSS
jgi:hypothetical protein